MTANKYIDLIIKTNPLKTNRRKALIVFGMIITVPLLSYWTSNQNILIAILAATIIFAICTPIIIPTTYTFKNDYFERSFLFLKFSHSYKEFTACSTIKNGIWLIHKRMSRSISIIISDKEKCDQITLFLRSKIK